jgi:trehalose-phosphatase
MLMKGPLPVAADSTELDCFMETIAQSRNSALLLDYDGTLAPFRANRREALPYPGVVSLLQEIMRTGRTRVVMVTGRCAPELVPLLGMDPVPEIWGSHGLQRLRPDGRCETTPLGNEVLKGLSDTKKWLAEQGLEGFAEYKPGGIAIHWRELGDTKAAEIGERVLRGLSSITSSACLEAMEFDGGVEIRMRGIDKGDVVRFIIHEIGSESTIAYLGDDTTDERAFEALEGRGVSVLVRTDWKRTSARLWLRPPGELLDFLERWLQACGGMGAQTASSPLFSRGLR